MYQRMNLGVMVQPGMGNRPGPDWPYWAADNGCFADKWDANSWLAWLGRLPRDGCLFATCPDVVGDAVATLALAHWLPTIRGMGFAPAYVAQDGIEDASPPWDDFDWLFVGGSTEFKLSATAVRFMVEAKRRGKKVHVGRVNSLHRLRWSRDHGADSADGTFVGFGPDTNLPKVRTWLHVLATNPPLPYQETA